MTRISPNLPCNCVVCRYDEIGIKGNNRVEFERRLAGNIQRNLHQLGNIRISRQRGRLFVFPPHGQETFPGDAYEIIYEQMSRVFGLASFSPAIQTAAELDSLQAVVMNTLPKAYEFFARDKAPGEYVRYAMRAHVKTTDFPMSKRDLEIHFADLLLRKYPLKVDLKHPELRVDVEIRGKHAFVAYERNPGPGGLPTGSAPTLIALLSGGIDSPVACYQAMKRGCSLRFVTFHSAPYTPEATVTKVARLARVLNQWQKPHPLLAINLLPAQKAIRDQCSPRFRTVLYRRMMMRLSTLAAHVYRAKGLVTGEALAQVASQTLENMTVISKATDTLILRPLLTFDKQETIRIAKAIQTFPVSIEEGPDSCTVFAPDKPVTAAKPEQVRAEEAKLDVPALITQCLQKSLSVDTETLEQKEIPDFIDAATRAQDQTT